MAEQETKQNNNKTMIAIICAIVVVVLIVALVFAFTGKKSDKTETANDTTTTTQQQGSDYSSRLGAIQEKIDAQQKVIDDLNNEMTPLIEQRTALEEQLMQLTLPDDVAMPEEPTEVPAE